MGTPQQVEEAAKSHLTLQSVKLALGDLGMMMVLVMMMVTKLGQRPGGNDNDFGDGDDGKGDNDGDQGGTSTAFN